YDDDDVDDDDNDDDDDDEDDDDKKRTRRRRMPNDAGVLRMTALWCFWSCCVHTHSWQVYPCAIWAWFAFFCRRRKRLLPFGHGAAISTLLSPPLRLP